MSDYDDVAAAAHAEWANQCAYDELETAIKRLEVVLLANLEPIPRDVYMAILTVLAEANNYRP